MKKTLLLALLLISAASFAQDVKRPSTTTINQYFTVFGGSEVKDDSIIGVTDTIDMRDYAPIGDTTLFTVVGDSSINKQGWIVSDTASLEIIYSEVAIITDVSFDSADVRIITADTAVISDLLTANQATADSADVRIITADTAVISDLLTANQATADSADVRIITADTAVISDLLTANQATVDSINVRVIVADTIIYNPVIVYVKDAAADTLFTVTLTDANKYLRCDQSDTVDVVIPLNASVAFPIGTFITFEQTGTGIVIIAGDGGVTVNAYGGLESAGQFAILEAIKVDENEWTVIGGQ